MIVYTDTPTDYHMHIATSITAKVGTPFSSIISSVFAPRSTIRSALSAVHRFFTSATVSTSVILHCSQA